MATEAELLAAIKALTDKIGNMDKKSGPEEVDTSNMSDEDAKKARAKAKAVSEANRKKDIAAELEYQKVLRNTANIFNNISEARKADMNILAAQLKESADLTDAQVEAIKRGEDVTANLTKEQLKVAEALREQYLMLQANEKMGKKNRKVLDGIAGSIGVMSFQQNSFLSSVIEMSEAWQMGGEAGHKALQQFVDDFRSVFSIQNLVYSTIMKIVESSGALLNSFDQSRAKLAGMTGAGYEFSDAMFEAQREANLYGVSMEEAGAATAALLEGTSNFAKMNEKTRKELTITTAKLQKLGIDGATASETFQFLNLNLGMTAEEAANTQKRIAMMGTKLGISSAKMTKDFNASLSTLAVYGDQAEKVFTNLAGAAKAAGVETSKLLGLAAKFDTFAGAADTVGKLNALLGTQLSTTQMLMMTEDERIETLIEQVQAQGVAFKDMDRFTQKAIAAAAGIDDMNEAQKIFGMNLGDYKKNQEEMRKNEEVQKKFNDAIDATVPIMQKFKLLATEIVISVQPLLEKLGAAAEYLTEKFRGFSTESKESFANVVTFVGGGYLLLKVVKSLYGGFKALAGLKAFYTGVTTTLTAAQTAETAAAAPAAAATTTFASSLGALTAALPTLGLALAGITLAIGAVTVAFSAYQAQKAKIAEAEAKEAEANARMAESYTKLAKTMKGFSQINFTTINAQVRQMVQELGKLGANGDIMIKTRATVENLALVSVGKARNSMTGDLISSSGVNNNIQNIFKEMKMVVEIGGEKFDAYVKDIAADVVTN